MKLFKTDVRKKTNESGGVGRALNQRHWLIRIAATLLLLVLGLGAMHIGQRLALLLHGVWIAQHWTPVTARLESWGEQVSSAAFSGRGTSVRMPMRMLQARYVYSFSGHTYTTERVSFTPVSDNISTEWRQGIVRRLQEASNGAPLTVWVNPLRPEKAVIERSLPVPNAVFSSVILLFPCGVATAYILGLLIRILGPRGKAGEARNQRWLLPLWALLHGLPVIPILALAIPRSIGIGSATLLTLLAMIGLAGMFGVMRNIRFLSAK